MKRFEFGRVAALQTAILLLLFAPLVLGGYWVWTSHKLVGVDLADLEVRYARLEGLLNHHAELQGFGAEVNKALTHLTYPSSQEVAKAGNDTQQRIRSIFAESQLDVISIQVLPAKEVGRFNQIPINLRVEGDLAGIQAALAKLESVTPAVLLDGMNLQTIGAVRPASVQRIGGQFNFSVFRVRS